MSERRGVMVDRREPRRDEGEEGCELLGVRGVNVVLVSWWCICWQVTAWSVRNGRSVRVWKGFF